MTWSLYKLTLLSFGLFSTLPLTARKSQTPLDALPLPLSKDDSFNFQLLLGLSFARYSAGDPAEILAAAQVIQPGSFHSFNSTFYKLANNSQHIADTSSGSRAKRLNTRDTYFAASSYWRSADFYNHGNWSDPLIETYWKHQTYCFNKAMSTLPIPGQRVTIPADGFDAIGIFYGQANNSTTKRPTLLIGNGYDGAQEDSTT
jgi:hypothetical protein